MRPQQRILTRIPDAELERRWAAVRSAMARLGLDALVLQNTNDWLGGGVKWLTDVPATNGYPRSVIFFAHKPMTVVEMGVFGGRRDLAGRDDFYRGVETVLTTPSFTSIASTHDDDGALVAQALAGARRIGWIGRAALPHGFVAHIESAVPATFVDATEAIDLLKAIKSEAEIALIRQCTALQDAVFARVAGFIRPGLRDIDVTAFAQHEALVLGSEQGIFLGASAPVGVRSPFMPRFMQGRALSAGDHLSLLIEVNGPGGFYAEIARTLVLGRASADLKAAFAHVKDAQDHTLSLLRPGAHPADILVAHNAWMTARGLPPEMRLYAHGQGYDMVERPLIRADETMPIARDMCLAVHPGYETDEVFAVICDNYMIGPDGPGACLHKTEKRLFEI